LARIGLNRAAVALLGREGLKKTGGVASVLKKQLLFTVNATYCKFSSSLRNNCASAFTTASHAFASALEQLGNSSSPAINRGLEIPLAQSNDSPVSG